MSKKIDWHRLMGLILQPMFERFGYETEVEVDLSFKKQLIDLTVVRKTSSSPQGTLPPEYLHPFEPLNDHNLISFKSHRESGFRSKPGQSYCRVSLAARRNAPENMTSVWCVTLILR
ncbi:hypothetical protein WDW89_12280 [Deltaproteobacteria bacterium TL4]